MSPTDKDQLDGKRLTVVDYFPLRLLVAIFAVALLSMATFSGLDFMRRESGPERLRNIEDIAEDTKDLVEFIEEAQSPEAQAAQAARLSGLVLQVDCNNRAALEEALRLPPSALTILKACPPVESAQP